MAQAAAPSPPSPSIGKRTLYVGVTIAAVVAVLVGLVAGYYIPRSSSSSSVATTLAPSVTGLTWQSTTLVKETSVTNSACTSSPGCNVTASSAIWCGNPCGNSGDSFEVVVFDVSVGSHAIICGTASTTVELTLSYAVGGVVTSQTPGYFYDTGAATGSTTITMLIDIHTSAVTQVIVTAMCL